MGDLFTSDLILCTLFIFPVGYNFLCLSNLQVLTFACQAQTLQHDYCVCTYAVRSFWYDIVSTTKGTKVPGSQVTHMHSCKTQSRPPCCGVEKATSLATVIAPVWQVTTQQRFMLLYGRLLYSRSSCSRSLCTCITHYYAADNFAADQYGYCAAVT